MTWYNLRLLPRTLVGWNQSTLVTCYALMHIHIILGWMYAGEKREIRSTKKKKRENRQYNRSEIK